MTETTLSGRIWVLAESGHLIEDIDTDQIFHNAFLHITDIAKMGQYALGNLKAWEDFSEKAGSGDIVIAGRNFGAGSSRQQAVDCFVALGISAILAPSFGAIYFRNAVNSGFPLLRSTELDTLVLSSQMETGDRITLDFGSSEAKNLTKETSFTIDTMSGVQSAIFKSDNLFGYGKTLDRE